MPKGISPARSEEISERHKTILEAISKPTGATIQELTEALNVSRPQIFIDIRQLRKTHDIHTVKDFHSGRYMYRYHCTNPNLGEFMERAIALIPDSQEKESLIEDINNHLQGENDEENTVLSGHDGDYHMRL